MITMIGKGGKNERIIRKEHRVSRLRKSLLYWQGDAGKRCAPARYYKRGWELLQKSSSIGGINEKIY